MDNSPKRAKLYRGQLKPILSLDNIKQYYNYPSHIAATHFGVCQSTLLRCVSTYGIKKWPYRKFATIQTIIDFGNDDEKANAISIKELLMSDPNIDIYSLISKKKVDKIKKKIRKINSINKRRSTWTTRLSTLRSKLQVTPQTYATTKVAEKNLSQIIENKEKVINQPFTDNTIGTATNKIVIEISDSDSDSNNDNDSDSDSDSYRLFIDDTPDQTNDSEQESHNF